MVAFTNILRAYRSTGPQNGLESRCFRISHENRSADDIFPRCQNSKNNKKLRHQYKQILINRTFQICLCRLLGGVDGVCQVVAALWLCSCLSGWTTTRLYHWEYVAKIEDCCYLSLLYICTLCSPSYSIWNKLAIKCDYVGDISFRTAAKYSNVLKRTRMKLL